MPNLLITNSTGLLIVREGDGDLKGLSVLIETVSNRTESVRIEATALND